MTINGKLTEEQAGQIIRGLNAGRPGTSLAREFGVSSGIVRSIRDNKTWQHLGEDGRPTPKREPDAPGLSALALHVPFRAQRDCGSPTNAIESGAGGPLQDLAKIDLLFGTDLALNR